MGLYCGEFNDDGTQFDGTAVALCEAAYGDADGCTDNGDPIPGAAFCVATVTSDDDNDYDTWQYEALCDDPPRLP